MPRIIMQQSDEERAVWAHRDRDHGAEDKPPRNHTPRVPGHTVGRGREGTPE